MAQSGLSLHGGRGWGGTSKSDFHDEGGRGVQDPPKKHGIICEQPLACTLGNMLSEMFGPYIRKKKCSPAAPAVPRSRYSSSIRDNVEWGLWTETNNMCP